MKPLGNVQVFCPDACTYRYVVVSTNGIIFALAVDMGTIAVRLDARMKAPRRGDGRPSVSRVWRGLGLRTAAGEQWRLAGGRSAVLGLESLCLRPRNKPRRIDRTEFDQLRRLALTRRPARLSAMKLFLAIFVYLLIGAVLSWGILLAMGGKPWLLVGSLIAYIVAFGKIGCTSH